MTQVNKQRKANQDAKTQAENDKFAVMAADARLQLLENPVKSATPVPVKGRLVGKDLARLQRQLLGRF